MYIHNPSFSARIAIVVGMLVAMGAATALVEAARPLSCTITPPFTATTPAVLTCDRPIAIDRDANTGGDLEYFGSDTDPSHFTIEAADTIIYDAISASQYVISPIQKWSGIDRVRFAATLTGLIPHTRIVDLAMPPPAPVAFFTESDKKGGTAIRRVTLEDGKLRVDAVTAGDNLSDVVFDGKYSLSYLKPEQANAGRAVAIFDTLSNTERIFRHALLGKAFTAFAPGGLGSDYAWIEQKPGSSADAFVDNGAAVTFSVRDTSNIADSFSNLIYSGDGLTLAVVNGARDRAYFIGLDRRGSTVQSPALAGKIKAAGFVGTDLLTPFVRTATQEWRYTGSAWQPSQAAHPLAYFICDAGYGYFDTDADAPRGCSKLTLDDHSITAKRNGLTATVYETANTLQWVESAVIPQVP